MIIIVGIVSKIEQAEAYRPIEFEAEMVIDHLATSTSILGISEKEKNAFGYSAFEKSDIPQQLIIKDLRKTQSRFF